MYAIIVYDVSVENVSKVCQYLRQYLNWIQNSCFEGEITTSELEKIKNKLNELINKNKDSVNIYLLRTEKAMKKIQLGIPKAQTTSVI